MSALLQTKLHHPQVRPGQVSRQRLLDRLNADLWSESEGARHSFTRKLTLVSAPAGFGKTTLVAEWIATLDASCPAPAPGTHHRRASWLSLDEAESDPVRFLTYLIAALQSAHPNIGLEAQVVLQSGSLPALDEAIVLLVNDLAAAAEPLVLVLDDYHVIHAEAVDQLLVALLERQPLNFHLVVAGRADPPLPLSRLRAQRQMLELRASDLRFSASEVATFLNQTMGLDLTQGAMAALEQRTEGWIAGLQLAALSLQGSDDREAFIREFSGSNRYIIDYLVDEVLRYQPPEVRSFLVQTCILDWLCAPLCDAVLAVSDVAGPAAEESALHSQAILNYLERTNLFLLPMDDQRRWYRYHHLFADSLRNELQPAQEVMLHRRAARWHADNGYVPRAVQHALAAPDHEFAAELLGEAGREASLWAGGDFKRYSEWVEMLPDTVTRSHPRLQLVYARSLQITGRLADAEKVLSEVEQSLRAAPDRDEDLLAIAAMYQSQCLLERGDLPRASDLAHRALGRLSQSTRLNHARALSGLACIEYGLGDFAHATPRFIQVGRMAESPSLAMNALECAARGLLLQGRLGAAQQMSEELLAASRTGATYNHLAAGAFATLSEVAYQRDTFADIVTYGDQAIELAQRMAPHAPLRAHEIWVYLQLARLRQVQGDDAGTAEALGRADQIAYDIQNDFYLQLAHVRETAHEAAREHDIPALGRVRPYPPVAFSYLDEYRGWIEVQVLLARRRPQDALAILDGLLNTAQQDGRGLSVIELQISRALTLHTLKSPEAARAALACAIEPAAPEGCVRPFLDAGAALTALLEPARLAAPAFVERLRLALSQANSPGRAKEYPASRKATPSLHASTLALQMEAPTEREIEILQLLADGLSNQEVGHKLFISVGTVKWYLTHLYSKLDVSSRTQAVARAREMGLVS